MSSPQVIVLTPAESCRDLVSKFLTSPLVQELNQDLSPIMSLNFSPRNVAVRTTVLGARIPASLSLSPKTMFKYCSSCPFPVCMGF